jgi:Ca2+-dependent lipid-binding protein
LSLKIISKVIYKNSCPEWNQQLKINFEFPTMCDKIELTIKDKDKIGKDEIIGKIILNIHDISEISSSGNTHFL